MVFSIRSLFVDFLAPLRPILAFAWFKYMSDSANISGLEGMWNERKQGLPKLNEYQTEKLMQIRAILNCVAEAVTPPRVGQLDGLSLRFFDQMVKTLAPSGEDSSHASNGTQTGNVRDEHWPESLGDSVPTHAVGWKDILVQQDTAGEAMMAAFAGVSHEDFQWEDTHDHASDVLNEHFTETTGEIAGERPGNLSNLGQAWTWVFDGLATSQSAKDVSVLISSEMNVIAYINQECNFLRSFFGL